MALVLSGDGSITGNPNITLTENVSIAGTVTYEDVTNVDSIGIITARSGINITGGSLDVQGNTTITGTLVASNGNITNGNITSEVDLTGISSSISDSKQISEAQRSRDVKIEHQGHNRLHPESVASGLRVTLLPLQQYEAAPSRQLHARAKLLRIY